MSISVAQIANRAFNAVSSALTGVIQSAGLIRETQGEYDPETGSYTTTTATYPCRAVFADERAMADTFPAYVVRPNDQMAYLEGLTINPIETDRVEIGSRTYEIVKTGDIVGVGEFFAVVVRAA